MKIILFRNFIMVICLSYKREKVLGVGGFASVYRGIYKKKTVAFKTFSSSLDATTLPYKNLRKELKVVSRIRHPYIVSVLGFYLRPDPTLCVELAEEGSLEQILENRSEFSYGTPNLTRKFKHKVTKNHILRITLLKKS